MTRTGMAMTMNLEVVMPGSFVLLFSYWLSGLRSAFMLWDSGVMHNAAYGIG